jgi:FkbM family methyltransferase
VSKKLIIRILRDPIFVVLMAVLLVAGALKANAIWRTRVYFSMERVCAKYWPSTGELRSCVQPALFEPLVPVRVAVEPGLNILLDPRDLVPRTILETGVWEPRTWALLKEHLPAEGTFVDVGAHIGYYSLKAAAAMGTNAHVIAVEPNPETVLKLRDNIRESGTKAISVAPVACSDSDGQLDLFGAEGTNTGETSLSRENAGHSGGIGAVYHVRARPLDTILQEQGVSRVDAIKIDVEGAEMLVLRGARQTLSRFSPVVVIEVVDSQLQLMGTSSAEITEFLRQLGYTARHSADSNVEFRK